MSYATYKTGSEQENLQPEQTEHHGSDASSPALQGLAGSRKVGILIVSYRSRELDHDNLSGGAKPVIDALRYAGYLNDDDQDSVKVYYRQAKCTREEEHTEIYIFPWIE